MADLKLKFHLSPLRDVVDDGEEQSLACHLDGSRVNLNGAYLAGSFFVWKFKIVALLKIGFLHFGLDLLLSQAIDIGDICLAATDGIKTIKCISRFVGIHNLTSIRIHDKHDGRVVVEQLVKPLLTLPQVVHHLDLFRDIHRHGNVSPQRSVCILIG